MTGLVEGGDNTDGGMPVMYVFLETDRLLLRRITDADVDNLFALDSDPEVMRYVGGKATPRDEVERDYLPAYLRYYKAGDRYGFWAAIEKSTGDFVGWFHLRPVNGEPELGYRLRTAAWGKGYATEGSRELLRKAFSELDVTRVVASAFAANVASCRVLERCGLTVVRAYYHSSAQYGEGEAVDYALTREDWQQLTKV